MLPLDEISDAIGLPVAAYYDPEQIEGANPLPESELDHAPFGRGHDAGNEIERKDSLRAGAIAVHVERDAHVQQRALRRLLAAKELAFGKRVDQMAQGFRTRPGIVIRLEHLIVEVPRFVVGESHRS